MTAPEASTDPVCYDGACDTPGPSLATDAPIVILPLEDAAARIVPNMMDTRARADLGASLGSLRAALLSGDRWMARVQLAHAYDALDQATGRLRAGGDAAVVLDLADLSAVRLALVPAAAALGVSVR